MTTSLEADLVKRLKYLSADTDRKLNDLLEEAIRLLLNKYEKRKQNNVKS